MVKTARLKMQKQKARGSQIGWTSAAKRLVGSNFLLPVLVAIAVLAGAAWYFSSQALETRILVEAKGEPGLGRIANASVAVGYVLVPLGDLNEHNDAVEMQGVASQPLDENGVAYFDRSLVALAEEKNVEKGTALFRISYNDGTQGNVVTMKIVGASGKANKIVFNLRATTAP